MQRLEDHAPELDGIIGSALFPGGVDQPGRIEGERVTEKYYGKVIGWFTMKQAASNGDHPDYAKESWIDVPLPVREEFYYPEGKQVTVLVSDAFNGLADCKATKDALHYWAELFSSHGTEFSARSLPTATFETNDGILEPNILNDW